jgi:hypothetical protein
MRFPVRMRRAGASDILLGILRVAFGRRDGLARFGATRQAFLASLAPLVAFPLVGGALMMAQGAGRAGVAQFLTALCALLAPPVLSFEVARLWGRGATWLRFATALNWCQWAIPAVAAIALAVLPPLLIGPLSDRGALAATLGAVGCYALWLHWFVARHGLGVSPLRGAALVLLVNLGTGVLVLGPTVLEAAWR